VEVSEFLQELPEFRSAHEVRVSDFLGFLPGTRIDYGNDEQFLSEIFEGVVHGNVEVRDCTGSLVGFHVVSEVAFVRPFRQLYVYAVLPERLGNYLVYLELRSEVVVEEQHRLVHAFQMTKNELERSSFPDDYVKFLVGRQIRFQEFLDFGYRGVVGNVYFRKVLSGESRIVVGAVRPDLVQVVPLHHGVVRVFQNVLRSVGVRVEILDLGFREKHHESFFLFRVV